MIDHSSPKLILVVDDDPLMQKLIGAQVKRAGHQVETAINGREALEQIRTLQPALITLDVMMPGLSGIDVLKVMAKDPASASIPVVLVTAMERSAVERLAVPQEMQVLFLNKPLTYQQLVDHIDEGLRRAAVRASVGVAA